MTLEDATSKGIIRLPSNVRKGYSTVNRVTPSRIKLHDEHGTFPAH